MVCVDSPVHIHLCVSTVHFSHDCGTFGCRAGRGPHSRRVSIRPSTRRQFLLGQIRSPSEFTTQNKDKHGDIIWLVVWTPLKNMKVNWDDYSQYMGKKKCSKPPTSNHIVAHHGWYLPWISTSLWLSQQQKTHPAPAAENICQHQHPRLGDRQWSKCTKVLAKPWPWRPWKPWRRGRRALALDLALFEKWIGSPSVAMKWGVLKRRGKSSISNDGIFHCLKKKNIVGIPPFTETSFHGAFHKWYPHSWMGYFIENTIVRNGWWLAVPPWLRTPPKNGKTEGKLHWILGES